jgi:hypothetical protein
VSDGPWTHYARRDPDEVDESDWVDVHSPDGSLVRIEGPVFALTEWTEDGHPTWFTHEQEWTVTPAGEHVEVDIGMVPILQEVWRLGFRTSYSCEGTKYEPAYIKFLTEEDQSRFISDVLGSTPHTSANSSVYLPWGDLARAILEARR